jgi:flagella basal body P-ring formation protein FlgA
MIRNIIKLMVFFGSICIANSEDTKYDITVRGYNNVTVMHNYIYLREIADLGISTSAKSNDVKRIGKIKIGISPNPGDSFTLEGSEVVKTLKQKLKEKDKIGYIFPQEIIVTRGSRLLQSGEVKQVITEYLNKNIPNATIKNIILPVDRRVALGDLDLKVSTPLNQSNGQYLFPITINANSNYEKIVEIATKLKLINDVLVARYSLNTGHLINETDLVRARMDTTNLPSNILDNPDELIGLEVQRVIPAGGFFKKDLVKEVPLIKSGAAVLIQYRKGILLATAKGTVIQSGSLGETIKVKNDSSKKILDAYVLSDRIVEVKSSENL